MYLGLLLFQAPVRSRSVSSAGSERDRKKTRRQSDSASESDEGDGRNKEKENGTSRSHRHRSGSKRDKGKPSKSKSKNKDHKSKRKGASPELIPMDDVPHEETLEELDARLEREENERIAEEKRRQLESVKMREPIVAASGGVTYKG